MKMVNTLCLILAVLAFSVTTEMAYSFDVNEAIATPTPTPSSVFNSVSVQPTPTPLVIVTGHNPTPTPTPTPTPIALQKYAIKSTMLLYFACEGVGWRSAAVEYYLFYDYLGNGNVRLKDLYASISYSPEALLAWSATVEVKDQFGNLLNPTQLAPGSGAGNYNYNFNNLTFNASASNPWQVKITSNTLTIDPGSGNPCSSPAIYLGHTFTFPPFV